MINVVKTFLPPQNEYHDILKKAWETNWLTNRGVLVKELEKKLKSYLKIDNVLITTNGTLPLQIAIKALKLNGEIITTPFSYVATASSIVWENCKPVFVDIHPEYLTIDETKIEGAINKNTSAILVTHVFGNPCNAIKIDQIAKKYNLKVIYDAAHCFGVKYLNQSIFKFGDISTCSFHATKLFHTGEGGAIISNNNLLDDEIFKMHNFGHKGKENFSGIGINAKISELQAAMGLAVLPYMSKILNGRKKVVELYNSYFNDLDIQLLKIRENTEWNYSYYPVIFQNEEVLKRVVIKLNNSDIYPRRYFYPSLNRLDYVDFYSCPVSESISSRILCLPLHYDLPKNIVTKISNIVISQL